MPRLHAFRADDALGFDDATALAERLRRREVSAAEVRAAAEARLAMVEPRLAALACPVGAAVAPPIAAEGVFAGVPSVIKDNTDVAGLPSRYGSAAVPARPAPRHGAFAKQFLDQGFQLIGKSALPEFGFNASTEPASAAPTGNPWNLAHSAGGSSGGSAALVAAGVVPIAHANDGGGSIRIPAACCGLVGLKPTRGRLVDGDLARRLPLNIVCEGVVTRSVRDSARFLGGAERHFRNPRLRPLGLVEGPGTERLRIGMVLETVTGAAVDADVRRTVLETAHRLERLGHFVEAVPPPVPASFVEDFTLYWGMLAFLTERFGRQSFGPGFDATRLDDLSRGLSAHYRRQWTRSLGVLSRLRRTRAAAVALTQRYAVLLSPVLAHPAPPLGHLHPQQPFEGLMRRLMDYVAFTPLNNTNGTPALALPTGLSPQGLPLSVQLSAGHGEERRLLELGYALEAECPFPRITDD